jgi:uncharacterized protein YqgC (DUF456 family)
MFFSLFLTPLGAPGNWIMLAIVGAGAWYGQVSWGIVAICAVAATVAEVLEFLLVKKLTGKYGGSRKAFWGAIVGGIIGVVVGTPDPVIGSIIAGYLGSFAGAAAVTWLEARDMGQAGRVGWGVLIGRMWAAAVKTAAGVFILVMGGAAFLF